MILTLIINNAFKNDVARLEKPVRVKRAIQYENIECVSVCNVLIELSHIIEPLFLSLVLSGFYSALFIRRQHQRSNYVHRNLRLTASKLITDD